MAPWQARATWMQNDDQAADAVALGAAVRAQNPMHSRPGTKGQGPSGPAGSSAAARDRRATGLADVDDPAWRSST